MEILNGINRSCKGLAGVSKLFLFSYVKYSRSQIEIDNNILVSFPVTELHEVETVGSVDFSEESNEDDGGVFYDINLSFKTNTFDNPLKIVNKDVRAVVLDNNGNYRLLGVFNGLTNESFSKTTGRSKTDFNGYEFKYSGKEQRESLFINDLEDITRLPAILQEDGYFLLQENGYNIAL